MDESPVTVTSRRSMNQCRICTNATSNSEFSVREMMFGLQQSFRYFQCSACGCLQIAEIPDDLTRYYSGDYYSFHPLADRSRLANKFHQARDGFAFTDNGLVGRMLYAIFPKIEYRFISKLKPSKSDRILDVGCGAGKLLRSLQRVGFQHLTGLDPFIDADIVYPNGITIHKAALSEFAQIQDVVMFNHSLEHMTDQQQALKDAAKLIKPSGIVVVRVPTVSSFAWKHYGTEWVQLDAPRHLFLHSRESMSMAASRAGLEVFDVFYDSGPFQFWGSEQCRKGIPLSDARSYSKNPARSVFTKSEIRRFSERAAELNKSGDGDQLAFFLRKMA